MAPKRDLRRTPRKPEPEVRDKMEGVRAVTAEITAANLELKKRFEVGRFTRTDGRDRGGNVLKHAI